jgi:hypothetical protein
MKIRRFALIAVACTTGCSSVTHIIPSTNTTAATTTIDTLANPIRDGTIENAQIWPVNGVLKLCIGDTLGIPGGLNSTCTRISVNGAIGGTENQRIALDLVGTFNVATLTFTVNSLVHRTTDLRDEDRPRVVLPASAQCAKNDHNQSSSERDDTLIHAYRTEQFPASVMMALGGTLGSLRATEADYKWLCANGINPGAFDIREFLT